MCSAGENTEIPTLSSPTLTPHWAPWLQCQCYPVFQWTSVSVATGISVVFMIVTIGVHWSTGTFSDTDILMMASIDCNSCRDGPYINYSQWKPATVCHCSTEQLMSMKSVSLSVPVVQWTPMYRSWRPPMFQWPLKLMFIESLDSTDTEVMVLGGGSVSAMSVISKLTLHIPIRNCQSL